MNLQDGVSISEGLLITLFSMGIVFITLVVISIMLGGFKTIFRRGKTDETKVKKAAPPIEDNVEGKEEDKNDLINDEELVAAISAAISMYGGNTIEKTKIKNIRRIPQYSPIWMKVGRERSVYNKIKRN